MAGFTPFKRNANKFKYTPRYYDPIKEELEQRRMELRGERRDESTEQGERSYTPGEYIRNKRMMREQRRRESMQDSRRRVWVMVAVVVLVFLIGSMIYPKLLVTFDMSSGGAQQQTMQEYEEFNPYRPIKVVPNDYNGE